MLIYLLPIFFLIKINDKPLTVEVNRNSRKAEAQMFLSFFLSCPT